MPYFVDASLKGKNSFQSVQTIIAHCCNVDRAIILDGFQKIGLRHRPLRQAYAHRILMHTHAEDLSELKSYLDDGPDYHTTFKLLYSDFQVSSPNFWRIKLAGKGRTFVARLPSNIKSSFIEQA